ncbi:hypothetical protein N7447_000392 [Penicillium robsamsonii]|uniref:uncharacterized protein n=1 Tax=Penicillium robsamsonii TaxID=1792511 RepID=UPI0025495CB8|nr:uncharacterized protein N7447_000392 [Penicillium robsamsonii]KAJ5834366.1 hypothetical protein N7447_000392 [Penicillium robsamsonii]
MVPGGESEFDAHITLGTHLTLETFQAWNGKGKLDRLDARPMDDAVGRVDVGYAGFCVADRQNPLPPSSRAHKRPAVYTFTLQNMI